MKHYLATEDDVFAICRLYYDVYQGAYGNPMMKDVALMRSYIMSPGSYWFLAKDIDGSLQGSVLISYDEKNLIAKAHGAVVEPRVRGRGVMEDLLFYGIQFVRKSTLGVEIVYSTTRTVNEAAQTLTEKLNFKKLGIFPNAHKTEEYETHGLAAIVYPEALESRHTDYKLHHEVAAIYDIVSSELHLKFLETIVPVQPTKILVPPQDLEVIQSPKFVNYRYSYLKNENKLEFEFFPFHTPNLVIMSPDQAIELFCHLSPTDGYCVVIGGKMPGNLNFTELFIKSNRLLREAGARYIEVLVRADRPKILDSIMAAKFIPCGFLPAFQKIGDKRYDFVVFSRSFEVFDFQNVKLKGKNQLYLEEYYRGWKRVSLNPKLLNV